VLAPAAHRETYLGAWGDNPRLKLDLRDIESVCQTAGLKSAPPDMLGERLFLHVLATDQPSDQFASDTLRRYYHLWRARLRLVAGGAAICAFTLLLAGLRTMELYGVNSAMEAQKREEAGVSQQYDRLQATFPKTPLPRETLKAAVGTAGILLQQARTPDQFLADISQALAAVPQIELDTLNWSISDDPRPRGATEASKAVAPPVTPSAPSSGGIRHFEVVEIAGRLNGVKGTDYRGISVAVEQFAQALRQRPGLEVVNTRTPFDALTEKQITGDVSEEDRAEVPRFTIRISRAFST